MAEKPVITIPEGEPPAELLIDDEIVGEGEEAVIGKRVIVHYVGVAWSNGQEFDASWNRGDTFDFRLGAREVIEGWDRGVKGMKVGGRRKLTIPPDLGYGSRGAGGDIKGGETLVFVDIAATRRLDPLRRVDRDAHVVDDTRAHRRLEEDEIAGLDRLRGAVHSRAVFDLSAAVVGQ